VKALKSLFKERKFYFAQLWLSTAESCHAGVGVKLHESSAGDAAQGQAI